MYSQFHLFAGLSVILAVLPAPASAQVGLGLSPMRTELRLGAGAQHSGVLGMSNDGSAKVRISGELLDFYIDDAGNPQFQRDWPAEGEYSCRKWLTVNPMQTELEAGGHADVRYTIRVPASATERSYHCAVGFSTRAVADQPGGTGLKTAVRVVGAFYVVVGQPTIEGTIKSLRLEPVPGTKEAAWRAALVIENKGLLHFRPQGKVELLDSSGKVIESADVVPMPVLPRRDQKFVFPLHVRERGEYKLRARVDIGVGEIQEATASAVADDPK